MNRFRAALIGVALALPSQTLAFDTDAFRAHYQEATKQITASAELSAISAGIEERCGTRSFAATRAEIGVLDGLVKRLLDGVRDEPRYYARSLYWITFYKTLADQRARRGCDEGDLALAQSMAEMAADKLILGAGGLEAIPPIR